MAAGSNPTGRAYAPARDAYQALGVDVDRALDRLGRVAISLHCWQGDDVGGFEPGSEAIGGGLAVTGSLPRQGHGLPSELRSDLETGPLPHPRHAPAEPPRQLRRDGRPARRAKRGPPPSISRAGSIGRRSLGLGIDFNPTFFAHPLAAADGFTLAHPDRGVREVLGRTRDRLPSKIGADDRRRELGSPVRHQRLGSRRLRRTRPPTEKPRASDWSESLDAVFAEPIDPALNRDAVESQALRDRVRGLCRSARTSSISGYAITRKKVLCLDAGHFHPTEVISDKVSGDPPLSRRDCSCT